MRNGTVETGSFFSAPRPDSRTASVAEDGGGWFSRGRDSASSPMAANAMGAHQQHITQGPLHYNEGASGGLN